MDPREKDIQQLCKAVLNMEPKFYDNPNGPYENDCPVCDGFAIGLGIGMDDIDHAANCAYLIAKDLSTGA